MGFMDLLGLTAFKWLLYIVLGIWTFYLVLATIFIPFAFIITVPFLIINGAIFFFAGIKIHKPCIGAECNI